MIVFKKKYLVITIFLLFIEIYIGLFVKDGFFRPYFGDFLVVILLYCFTRTFFEISIFKTALGILLFSYFLEFLQFVEIMELWVPDNPFFEILLGNSFDWQDLIAYFLGILMVLVFEKFICPQLSN